MIHTEDGVCVSVCVCVCVCVCALSTACSMIHTEDGTPAAKLHKILITTPDKAEAGLVFESQKDQSFFQRRKTRQIVA